MSENDGSFTFLFIVVLPVTFIMGWLIGWAGVREYPENKCVHVEVKKNSEIITYWECR